MITTSNYQDLLKFFAMITMIVDHIGLYFFPESHLLRLIGRTSMPVFCFFAGYNFKEQPKSKILLLGVLLYLITSILLKQITPGNILISIYMGQCYLYIFRNKLDNIVSSYVHVFILGMLGPVTCFFSDYGSLAVAIMLLGYIATTHADRHFKTAIFISIILSILHTFTVFNFLNVYIQTIIILGVLQYFLMTIKAFDHKIELININIISRNMVFVYVFHLIIIQAVFSCLYL